MILSLQILPVSPVEVFTVRQMVYSPGFVNMMPGFCLDENNPPRSQLHSTIFPEVVFDKSVKLTGKDPQPSDLSNLKSTVTCEKTVKPKNNMIATKEVLRRLYIFNFQKMKYNLTEIIYSIKINYNI